MVRTPQNTQIEQPDSAFAITPSDTSDLVLVGVKLFVGTGGDIKVDMYGSGTAVVFSNIANGSFLPVRVKRVYATDTTAGDIVGVY